MFMSHIDAIASLNSSRALICDASLRIALRKGATCNSRWNVGHEGTCSPLDQSLSYMRLRVGGMAELCDSERMLQAKSMNCDFDVIDECALARAMNPIHPSGCSGKHTSMEGGFNAVRQPERKFAA
jgi:hypothetical protein